jgi:hypothetical protein
VSLVSKFDLPRRTVQPSGNLSVGLDQEGCHSSSDGRLGNLRQVVIAESLGSGLFELLAQLGQSRVILRLDKLPGAPAEFVDGR